MEGDKNVTPFKGEPRPRNPEDGVSFLRNVNRLADDCGITAVVALPEGITEHGDRWRITASRYVSGGEVAPHQVRHAKELQPAWANFDGSYTLRNITAGHC